MNKILALIESDLSTDLLILVLLVMVGLFVFAQFKKDSFDIRDVLLDPQTGKISIHSLGQFLALIISSWGLIYQTLHQQLTEWLFGTYMAIWAGASVASRVLGRSDDNRGDSDHHDGTS